MGSIKTILISALFIVTGAQAIVIRHDLEDKEYLALGEQFSQSVAYIGGCAATLIDSNWVLTAAHCIEGREDIFFVRHIDTKYRIENIFIHPKFNRKNDEIYDIALVQLKDAIKRGKPALLYQGINEMGLPVIFIGRGTFGNGKDGLIRDDNKQRGATNTVDMVNKYVIGFTFNSPPKATKYEGISSRGDSGGPAFVKLDNKLYVIGVSSYQEGNDHKEGYYGVGEYYTRVSKVYPWLRAIIDKTPVILPPKSPVITAIKNNDRKALGKSINDNVLQDTEVMHEAFYQSIILDVPELAEMLLKSGISISAITINKMSLFEFSLQQNRKQYYRMLQQLSSNLTDIHPNHSSVLPLFISRFKDDAGLLEGVQALLNQGANIDAQTDAGDTALIVTGWKTNKYELFKLLILNGANLNIPNNNGDTPLIDAVYLNKIDNLKILVEHGADINIANKRGETALQLAKKNNNELASSLLEDAIKRR